MYDPEQVRAGAGGAEAALFAAQMLELYGRYARSKGWDFEVRITHNLSGDVLSRSLPKTHTMCVKEYCCYIPCAPLVSC
jgi:hypothetical protein